MNKKLIYINGQFEQYKCGLNNINTNKYFYAVAMIYLTWVQNIRYDLGDEHKNFYHLQY